MNIEGGFRGQSVHRMMAALLVTVLAFGLLFGVSGLSGAAADSIDFNHACSIRAIAGSPEQAADLAGKLQIDLYQIAAAEEVSGYDTYSYTFAPDFEEVEEIYHKDSEQPDWKGMAQKAAELIFAENSGIQPAASGLAEETVPVPGCGLYLVIARGSDLSVEKYKTTVEQMEEGKIQKKITTLAYSADCTYIYEPELVSIPNKAAEDGTLLNTTAGNGTWMYAMDVTLKPTEKRFGSLEIVKELMSYEKGSEAVFVFQIDAVLNGENVYSNVVSITFDSAGEKSVIVDRIPAGAQVTVTEIYSGAGYKAVSSVTVTPADTISVKNILKVSFTNDYAGTPGGGGAVTNHFEYKKDNVNARYSEWKWNAEPEQQGADSE